MMKLNREITGNITFIYFSQITINVTKEMSQVNVRSLLFCHIKYLHAQYRHGESCSLIRTSQMSTTPFN